MSARTRTAASKNQSISRARDGRHNIIAERNRGIESVVVAEDRIERERALWIQQRQTELDRIFDIHDTLIREAFHLEKWTLLLSYDPKAAKEDRSAVFQEYQAQYDLVDHSATPGPTRTTRRAHTERVQALKAPQAPAALSRPRKPKAAVVNGKPGTNMDVSSLSKGKSVQPGSVFEDALAPRQHAKGKGKGKMKASQDFDKHPAKRAGEDYVQPDAPRPHKKRRITPSAATPGEDGEAWFTTDSFLMPPPPHRRTSNRRSRQSAVVMPPSTPPMDASLPLPSKPALRRIKLIVRRPDPEYSNPRQKPPAPQYGESLTSFLSSFTILDDKVVDESTEAQLVRKEAQFWRRVDVLQREGRFFPDSDLLLESSGTSAVQLVPQDPWAHVVEAVKARSVHQAVNGRQVAAQVANRVRAYWESRAVKEDRVKLQEEKRLRALAKATVKMVVAEWKKAVYHVREEERLKREEEERRRGHEHLDAILDQSGQILEAQQLDLSKAASRSRSSSVSATLRRWASSSPAPDEASTSESEDEGQNGEEGSGSDEDDNDEGIDSSLLLGHDDHLSRRSRSASLAGSVSLSRSASVPASQDDEDLDENQHARSPSAAGSIQLADVVLVDPPSPSQDAMSLGPDTPIAEASPRNNRESSNSTRFASSPTSPDPEMIADIASPINSMDLTKPVKALDAPELTGEVVVGQHNPIASDIVLSEQPLRNGDAAIPLASSQPQLAQEPSGDEQQGDMMLGHTMYGDSKDITMADLETAGAGPDNAEERVAAHDDAVDSEVEEDINIPSYLRPFAVAPVEWDPQSKVKAPFLLRGNLRPYQQAGLEWLASLHTNNLNGILADEMGLGKTIQTISLLAHLACDRGIWGPHLIIVPTSVLLNWEMEFKKFLPGFKVLSYHGSTKRRKELRQGWNNKYSFNVCVTSYTLASRDAHVFKRKPWYYMILDEAHMIKNFRSQRWNILLMFRSFRRLLLTGTPLQNNLTELWALLQFLMSGTNFANLKEFGEWFSNPLEKAIEMGTMDDETQQRVAKLHTVLRPYLLRRLKRDVEKELPQKYEHLVMCPLSKRQRFLYDEFMARAETRHDLQSGTYHKIANILMQLRKVVNHPDLFEVRPIVTSFTMDRSAIADFEIKEFLIRRELFGGSDETRLNLDVLGLQFIQHQNTSLFAALETHRLDGTSCLPMITELPGEPPPKDTRTIDGFRQYRVWQQRAASIARWAHIRYLNRLRCSPEPIYSRELIAKAQQLCRPIQPSVHMSRKSWDIVDRLHAAVKAHSTRAEEMAEIVNRFAFATPAVVARDLPALALASVVAAVSRQRWDPTFDAVLHRSSVKLQIAFPDPSLLQYDCGKLQELSRLLRERKAGGHRILIFTQMTKILDILEIFLNLHGYLYLRLDGATKIEDRQYITERFNSDQRIFCFISSSRSGGVGINLTGADTVIFYDSDFNPQMDRQCEDRAHRIGQIRDVHIYRFVSRYTVEEALLRKANQKRSLDDIVIQKGEFDWRSLFSDEMALTKALGEFEDTEDAHAAAVAASEEVAMVGADEADFTWEGGESAAANTRDRGAPQGTEPGRPSPPPPGDEEPGAEEMDEDEPEEGGTTIDYMLAIVRSDMDYFGDWRI
ncbi:hypothetical protein WOLCODRAFT_126206 [Wolfiporia cocos MD-104 SS10]|uniref:DNA helicase n=1 Tax=Wolfiporia cocos (strain MD-104) TaxID=742152 RepID=A0A2H3J0F2_WOLCO|nr:hypothetical protein WOLCODRAFT_126206 [Wolfiporia cocos MD-104 SS10]